MTPIDEILNMPDDDKIVAISRSVPGHAWRETEEGGWFQHPDYHGGTNKVCRERMIELLPPYLGSMDAVMTAVRSLKVGEIDHFLAILGDLTSAPDHLLASPREIADAYLVHIDAIK